MKKIILSLLLSVYSLLVFSQETFQVKTIKNCAGKWNILSQEYDFSEVNYAVINFTFTGDLITVDDESQSFYRVLQQLPKRSTDKGETISAKCLDEKNRECVFGLMRLNDGSMTIGVVYDSIIYVYFIEQNKN